MTKNIITIIFVWFMSYTFAISQDQKASFDYLTTMNGLSHSWVHCVLQDSYGFIWIGTEDGLNKYDGVKFTIYKNKTKDPNSIINNSIKAIYEDSIGNLWINTNKGLSKYERKTDKFITKKKWLLHASGTLAKTPMGLWIGTFGKLVLKTANDSIIDFKTITKNKFELFNCLINCLHTDSKERLWIGTPNGLYVYDEKNNTLVSFAHDKNVPNSISGNYIISIFEDSKGRIWVGTKTQGLNLLKNTTSIIANDFIHFKNNKNTINSINPGTVLALLEDENQNLWIGLENHGLDKLNIQSSNIDNYKFIHHQYDPDSKSGINNNSIHALQKDTQGTIWIGTYGNGLNMLNKNFEKFSNFIQEPNNKKSINNNLVNAICDDENYLWIGTEGGLNRYDKKNKTFKYYVHDAKNKNSISSNAVWKIYKDSKNNLWVGTWAGGLNLFDYEKETFKHYLKNPNDSLSIGSNNIFDIAEDKSGNLWLGTMGDGLNKFNLEKKTFRHYNFYTTNLQNGYIESVTIINNKIWVSNVSVVSVFDINTEKFEMYQYNSNDSTSLSGIQIFDIYKDKKDNIWVCTEAGLNLFNPETKDFTCYETEDGLPDNAIKSITSDNKHNLWIGTNKGLSVFYNAENLPQKPKFKNYYQEDGLQGNEFNRRSCMKTVGGKLYFGGPNGLSFFHPDSLNKNQIEPPVIITDFLIFNKKVEIGKPNSPLKSNINIIKEITLSYKHSVFTFKFAALNYIVSKKNQYAVMLDGFENEWRYIGNQKMATYTNIDPGKYIFKVKASNNDGVWNEEGASVIITILPPYWQTWWFKTIVIVILFGGIFGFFIIRLRIIKMQKQKLEMLVNKRTKELKISNYMLAEKQEEILQQNEEILQQNEGMHIINSQLKSKNKKITYQKEEIEKTYSIVNIQNKNIKGSIRYAKTIQHAVLPSIAKLNKSFENFLIFKPKDVVSGDFYWSLNLSDFENLPDLKFIAVVDCTGHGVPGAFMSIIGITLLNEIVKIKKIYEPEKILSELNNQVKTILQQEETNNDDGMDVCLCQIIKLEYKYKVIFSGAKRPLFIYRKNENKLISIKGSIKSIGGKFYTKQEYLRHELLLDEGDLLYLSSDGYVDQCNPERKNFSSRNLKKIIENNARKPLKEQQEILEKELSNYQQDVKQRDDITILGLKLSNMFGSSIQHKSE